MAEDKKEETKDEVPAGAEANPPPKDALGKTNEELNATDTTGAMSPDMNAAPKEGTPAKKPNALKKLLKHVNIYLFLFIFILIVGAVIVFIGYLNSKKAPITPAVGSQTLSQSELKQLANSNATVGGSGQTITIQGNTVFSGQVLVRSNLNVAGTIQLGGNLSVASINVSTTSNLSKAQANSLQVTGATVFQGLVTIQNGLNATGSTSINNATIGTVTATKVIMSGNAQLQIPNHIGFSGSATPGISGQNGASASIVGSDTSGTVTINTGGAGSGCLANLSFAHAYFNSKPNVIISLVSSSPVNIEYYAGSLSTSGFSFCSANAPPSNTQIAFSYFITASTQQ